MTFSIPTSISLVLAAAAAPARAQIARRRQSVAVLAEENRTGSEAMTMKRLRIAVCLTTALVLGSVSGVSADEPDNSQIENIYAFGDSLTDSGNLFALTGNVEPPSPPYFGGFSNGPVWVEKLAGLLGLEIDFDTTILDDPLANNQAVGGAFTDTRNSNDDIILEPIKTGILSQIVNFEEAGGRFEDNDLVIVWGGANNYIFDFPFVDPVDVVDDLKRAIEGLSDLGGKRFLVLNLPNLGDTPFAQFNPPLPLPLNSLTEAHNAALAEMIAELREVEDIEIVELDINVVFDVILEGTIFPNVSVPCLIQQPDRSRFPTGACGFVAPFDATGTVFWDLLHPTAAAHQIIALIAHAALIGAMETPEEFDVSLILSTESRSFVIPG